MSKEIVIDGVVVTGKKLGRKLGFPTINVFYDGNISGVFVGEILLDGKWLCGAVHAGKPQTFDKDKAGLEVHVLNFKEEMRKEIFPGKKVKIKLLSKIRDTEKFKNPEELKEKISQDVKSAKNWYNLPGGLIKIK